MAVQCSMGVRGTSVASAARPAVTQHLRQRAFHSQPWHMQRSGVCLRHINRARGTCQVSASYQDSDRKVYTELDGMKKAAKDYVQAILSGIKSDASGRVTSGRRESLGNERLKQNIRRAIDELQEGLIERETEVRLLLLAALTQEHILYIGPPGTAKSEIGRRLSRLLRGTYFERLLTRFSVPEELFGPLSMRALEEDKYIRQIRGYLPDAQVAFIDEIFKANSAILNTLLTVLNERLFDNGSARVKVPLITLVGASNELPESEELDALYDRFLVRKQVKQVSAAGLTELLDYYANSEEEDLPSQEYSYLLSKEDFETTLDRATRSVTVPRPVIQLLADLRQYLQENVEPPVYVSDRRLVKSVALMQVAAYCNGRTTVTEYDCLLLQHILWNKPEQADRIADWVLGQLAIDDGTKQVQYLLSGIFSRACRALGRPEQLEEIKNEVEQLRGLLVDKLTQVSTNLEGGFPVIHDNLWLAPSEADSIASTLVPKLKKTAENVEQVLYDVATLEIALDAGVRGSAFLVLALTRIRRKPPPLRDVHNYRAELASCVLDMVDTLQLIQYVVDQLAHSVSLLRPPNTVNAPTLTFPFQATNTPEPNTALSHPADDLSSQAYSAGNLSSTRARILAAFERTLTVQAMDVGVGDSCGEAKQEVTVLATRVRALWGSVSHELHLWYKRDALSWQSAADGMDLMDRFDPQASAVVASLMNLHRQISAAQHSWRESKEAGVGGESHVGLLMQTTCQLYQLGQVVEESRSEVLGRAVKERG